MTDVNLELIQRRAVGEFPHNLMCSESAACASCVGYPIPQAMTASNGHGRQGPTEGIWADVTVSPCFFSLLFNR